MACGAVLKSRGHAGPLVIAVTLCDHFKTIDVDQKNHILRWTSVTGADLWRSGERRWRVVLSQKGAADAKRAEAW